MLAVQIRSKITAHFTRAACNHLIFFFFVTNRIVTLMSGYTYLNIEQTLVLETILGLFVFFPFSMNLHSGLISTRIDMFNVVSASS